MQISKWLWCLLYELRPRIWTISKNLLFRINHERARFDRACAVLSFDRFVLLLFSVLVLICAHQTLQASTEIFISRKQGASADNSKGIQNNKSLFHLLLKHQRAKCMWHSKWMTSVKPEAWKAWNDGEKTAWYDSNSQTFKTSKSTRIGHCYLGFSWFD